ncbi:MAG: T9SS type A sorting domain-containing protein [Candidatus Cloacimonadaceae bacterium]|nr:T9SS type A sorting domain-containing protein [Candidatus Cloacimonadaceae bacterium]
MKRILLPIILIVMPFLLMGNIFNYQATSAPNSFLDYSRAWRLQERMTSYKNGELWEPSARMIPYYQNNQSTIMDSLYMDSYDLELNMWIPGMMVAYFEYNPSGQITDAIYYMNIMEIQFPMLRQVATYDEQNRITHIYFFGGDLENLGNWIPMSRMHMIYGPDNTFEAYGWEEDEEERIVHYFHSTFEYDAQGRVIEDLTYISPDSLSWAFESRSQYQYHAQDSSTGADYIQNLSDGLSSIVLDDGLDYPGMVTSEIYELWDGSAWIPERRSTLQYDANLKLSQRLEEVYLDSTWLPEYKYLHYYDDNGMPDYLINQSYYNSEFVDDDRIDYVWETYTSDNDDPSAPMANLKLLAYPSPFVDDIRIKAQSSGKAPVKLSIYNMRGQKVQSFETPANGEIIWDGKDSDGRRVSSGIYFIKANQGDQVSTRKVLRLK